MKKFIQVLKSKFITPAGRIKKTIFIPIAFIIFIVTANYMARPAIHGTETVFLPDEKFLPSFISDIANAKSQIYCTMYMFKTDEFDDSTTGLIKDSLIDASFRGVTIHIVFENGDDDEITTKFNKQTAKKFKNTNINVYFDSPERRLHSKMCVIDDISYIGSHNHTYSAMRKNAETSVRIKSGKFAAETTAYIKNIINMK